MMILSKVHSINLPSNFPFREMEAFKTAADSILTLEIPGATWQEYAGATNLIGWRFRGCYEDMNKWIDLWNHCDKASSEEIYLRERALFGFFTAGLSCVETTCYALYALARHLELLDPQLLANKRDKWHSNPSEFNRLLLEQDETLALKARLQVLIASDDYKCLKDRRNRMNHRSDIPINYTLNMGAELPPTEKQDFVRTTSTEAFNLGVSELEAMFNWLATSVRDLLVEGTNLCERP
ncbi:hypothetical protein V3O24_00950 [Methylobacter sp. Wu8]|uniref:hypothetical protein n=1 Tax=Methylobacter sp. Wu8 TaxID=3118457 RepID=UPI002F319232